MKNMLESSFPGVEVILANYPPLLPKRLLSKVVPVVQFGIIATIMAGEQIFPRLGMAPPPWYYSLRANRLEASQALGCLEILSSRSYKVLEPSKYIAMVKWYDSFESPFWSFLVRCCLLIVSIF